LALIILAICYSEYAVACMVILIIALIYPIYAISLNVYVGTIKNIEEEMEVKYGIKRHHL